MGARQGRPRRAGAEHSTGQEHARCARLIELPYNAQENTTKPELIQKTTCRVPAFERTGRFPVQPIHNCSKMALSSNVLPEYLRLLEVRFDTPIRRIHIATAKLAQRKRARDEVPLLNVIPHIG